MEQLTSYQGNYLFTFYDLYTITHPISRSFRIPSWFKALELQLNPNADRVLPAAVNFKHKFCYGYNIKKPTSSSQTTNVAVGWYSPSQSFVLGRITNIEQDVVHLMHFLPMIGLKNFTVLDPCGLYQLHNDTAVKLRGHHDRCFFMLPIDLCIRIPVTF